MKFIKKTITAAAIAGMAFSMQANATTWTFDEVGDTQTIIYSASYDGATLYATIGLTLTSLTDTQAVFGVTAQNFSTGPGDNRLVSFGIDVVDPTLTGASTSGTSEWNADFAGQPGPDPILPSFGHVDLCAFAGPNCSGGSNDGVLEGQTDSFTLTLTTSSHFWADSNLDGHVDGLTFTSPFASKWQSVGVNERSYEFDHCVTDCPTPPERIPEPGTLLLFSAGLVGLGFLRRRKV